LVSLRLTFIGVLEAETYDCCAPIAKLLLRVSGQPVSCRREMEA
jgi:hypothetical protein